MNTNDHQKIEQIFAEYLLDCPSALLSYAYAHSYSVVSMALFLAELRKEDKLVCGIAALFHDCALFNHECNLVNHAETSALICQELLEEHRIFTSTEIALICDTIKHHSEKAIIHQNGCIEVLKDADLISKYLQDPGITIKQQDYSRLSTLLEELHLNNQI